MTDTPDRMRLDKWLWAARFYKTRKLAAEAVQGGKVHLNGLRSKPGREVQPGTRLTIGKGPFEWDITVAVIPRQRRPASEARHFYTESEHSHARRQEIAARMRAEKAALPGTHHRPNKRERRLIHRFKQSANGSG